LTQIKGRGFTPIDSNLRLSGVTLAAFEGTSGKRFAIRGD